MDKALSARVILSEALGPILGGIVLLIIDIVFTILVKPILNLLVYLHNKKEEKAQKAEADRLAAELAAKKAEEVENTQDEPIEVILESAEKQENNDSSSVATTGAEPPKEITEVTTTEPPKEITTNPATESTTETIPTVTTGPTQETVPNPANTTTTTNS